MQNIREESGHVDFQVQAQRQNVNMAQGRKKRAIPWPYSVVVGYASDIPPIFIKRNAYEDQNPPNIRKVQLAQVFPTTKHKTPTMISTRPLVVKRAPINVFASVTPRASL